MELTDQVKNTIVKAAKEELDKHGLLEPSATPLVDSGGAQYNAHFVKLCGHWIMVWYEYGKWKAQYQQSMDANFLAKYLTQKEGTL